jgi:hypothetical protein
MDSFDRKQKWMRLYLQQEDSPDTKVYWVQLQDGSFKSILKFEGTTETTFFANETFFRQYVFQFLHALSLDDDP